MLPDPAAVLLDTFSENATRLFILDSIHNREFTYSQLQHMASDASRRLLSTGLEPGARVAVIMPNCAELVAIYFGCLFAGLTVVPINPGTRISDIATALKVSRTRLLLFSTATERALEELPGVRPERIKILLPGDSPSSSADSFMLSAEAELSTGATPHTWADEEIFLIPFTSGTTGTPKGVCHRPSRLLANAAAFNHALGFDRNSRFVHVMPMTYMAGILNTLICPFLAGGSVVLANQFGASSVLRFWEPIIQHEANTLWLTPTMLAALLKMDRSSGGPDYCRANIRAVCVGTAPLPLKTRKLFEKRYGVPVLESYGLSELLFVTTNTPAHPVIDGSVGRPIDQVKIRIRNQGRAAMPTGKPGSIWINTPYSFAGYLDQETGQPDPANAGKWFDSGDIGYTDTNGHLSITDRKKDLIIRGGLNISPRAVEEILDKHDAIELSAVIGLPHDFYGEEVVAVVKLRSGHALEDEMSGLLALCGRELQREAVPSRFVEMESLPTSVTGKIDKASLKKTVIQTQKP